MLFDRLQLFFYRAWAQRRIRQAGDAIPDGRTLLQLRTPLGREVRVVFNKNTETPCFQMYVDGIGAVMPPSFLLLKCVEL